MSAAAKCDLQQLGRQLLAFTTALHEMDAPDAVLNGLHAVTASCCEVNVLAAVMFPLRCGDRIEKGRNVFLHRSVPVPWWEEYRELSRKYPGTSITVAQAALAPFTVSELMRSLEPVGIERWSVDLAIKYGMRDGLTCPVGGRWAIAYWSRQVLTDALSAEVRALLFMGASFAAIRLDRIVRMQPERIGTNGFLTPRELAVLRLMSLGHQIRAVAELLELGEETVRTHLKKAQAKLGVSNRTHAVAQAIRRGLIP
jgi:LuxR family quorum sensing-dependent transcriptional regulator